tara:strand:- start:1014 stop:1904 length:891 start_codon:yes stop_codon:yes gene_type:complete
MKVILTGASGQLGQALIEMKPKQVEIISLSRNDLDLENHDACRQIVLIEKPDWIINAGAYTAVDNAEKELDLAYAINELAPAVFASALSDIGGRLLQISTDFVFNGKQGSPYKVNQLVNPLSVYGSSKAAGEKAVLNYLNSYVIRTSWLYGPVRQNFCLTMLRLHAAKASSGEVLRVVSDQISCPTSTRNLSLACWRFLFLEEYSKTSSILHWSDAGVASWYDFAVAIGELGVFHGLLKKSALVQPITTKQYPTPAKRPPYSLLDCSETIDILQIQQQHWKTALSDVLQQLRLRLA